MAEILLWGGLLFLLVWVGAHVYAAYQRGKKFRHLAFEDYDDGVVPSPLPPHWQGRDIPPNYHRRPLGPGINVIEHGDDPTTPFLAGMLAAETLEASAAAEGGDHFDSGYSGGGGSSGGGGASGSWEDAPAPVSGGDCGSSDSGSSFDSGSSSCDSGSSFDSGSCGSSD